MEPRASSIQVFLLNLRCELTSNKSSKSRAAFLFISEAFKGNFRIVSLPNAGVVLYLHPHHSRSTLDEEREANLTSNSVLQPR